MRQACLSAILLLTAAFALPAAPTGQDLSPAQIDDIIQKFALKESEFARAREAYTYRQSVKVQEMDESGRPAGKYEIISDIVFNADGKRDEKVVRAPQATLQRISLTPEDEQDLRAVQPFVLTSKDIDKYHVRYLGRQKVDEIGTYSFAVKPKQMLPGQRYFTGIIWVDDRDLQIVKSYGRAAGIIKKGFDNQFPKFETYREQVDGKYWFPTFTIAEDTLNFETGPQPIKMTVRYDDYKRFKSETTITFGDEVEEKNQQKPQNKP